MSDESSSPPALRLKARLRPAEGTPDQASTANPSLPASSAAPTAPTPAASIPAPAKIRLKPRLDSPSPGSESSAPATSPAPATDEMPRTPAPSTIIPGVPDVPAETPAGPVSAEVPRIRLKARPPNDPASEQNASVSSNAPAVGIPASASIPAVPRTIPPTIPPTTLPPTIPLADVRPVLGSADAAIKPARVEVGNAKPTNAAQRPPVMIGGLPVSPHPPAQRASVVPPPTNASAASRGRTPPPFPVLAQTGAPANPNPKAGVGQNAIDQQPKLPLRRKRGSGNPFKTLLLLVLVIAAGYYAWTQFMTATPENAPAAVKPTSAPPPTASGANTPSETLNRLALVPSDAIQKAKDAISARRDSEQSRVDVAGIAEEPPAKLTTPASAPAPTMSGATVTKSVAPGLTATVQINAGTDTSVAFREFVANARISGVVAARAIINGRLVRAGELVDPALGISFQGYDADSKQLLFRDRMGAQVARRY